MVAAAVGELRGGDVDDALAGATGNLVYKAHEILVAVAEAHATSDAALEETGRAREVERHHALILVPDVDHSVQLRIARAYIIYIKQRVPILAKLAKGLVYLLRGVEALDKGVCLFLVDYLRGGELLVLFVLDIAEQEHEILLLAGLQRHLDVVRGDGAPSVGVAVARLALHHCLRIRKLVI